MNTITKLEKACDKALDDDDALDEALYASYGLDFL